MKGYRALVGFDVKKGGMFALFSDEQKAREWVKKSIRLHLTINPKLKAEGKIEIVEVRKCKNPNCNKLTEETYCLGCEEILGDLYLERLEVEET
ncbi:MAG: hypothetical protein AABY22_18175 [Nanoarchaeota archaeon]